MDSQLLPALFIYSSHRIRCTSQPPVALLWAVCRKIPCSGNRINTMSSHREREKNVEQSLNAHTPTTVIEINIPSQRKSLCSPPPESCSDFSFLARKFSPYFPSRTMIIDYFSLAVASVAHFASSSTPVTIRTAMRLPHFSSASVQDITRFVPPKTNRQLSM